MESVKEEIQNNVLWGVLYMAEGKVNQLVYNEVNIGIYKRVRVGMGIGRTNRVIDINWDIIRDSMEGMRSIKI